MLVLTRRIGEEIVIADDIHVSVLSIKGKQIRIGITAPRSVPVARRELLENLSPDLRREPVEATGESAHS
jgi:carbon storage regulator